MGDVDKYVFFLCFGIKKQNAYLEFTALYRIKWRSHLFIRKSTLNVIHKIPDVQ